MEGSFGAYLQGAEDKSWEWNRDVLLSALDDLEGNDLVRQTQAGIYELTELGWLAGQGGVEVESIIRIVSALVNLSSDSINDPTLIAITQLTVELDDVYLSINSKGHRRELQTWTSELSRQSIPQEILQRFHHATKEEKDAAVRAKRTAACLLWITDTPMVDIEEGLTIHGGRFNGAAGPTRSVSSRTQDLLPIVVRVAEILHEGLDLSERVSKLSTRLEVGAPASVVEVASILGSRLSRANYLALSRNGLNTINAVEQCPDEDLLSYFENDTYKLEEVRTSIENFKTQERESLPVVPIIPLYEQ